ncbi:MAG TPA: glycosyltransferase, partial [Candidatus Bathyarchaeota archaeon]|nr:glycosyltransferase [Candidatus Bathyarchaeota archaeon]
ACGTLVIGTDTTGLRDAILHGETGFLVPYGKPKKIAAAICKVINDDKLRERLSRKAKEWGERFDWKTTLDKFEKVILQVSAMGKRGYSS